MRYVSLGYYSVVDFTIVIVKGSWSTYQSIKAWRYVLNLYFFFFKNE